MHPRASHSVIAGFLSVLLLLQFAPLSLLIDQNAKRVSVVCEGHGERAVCPHHQHPGHDRANPAGHASHETDHTPGKADKPHRDGPVLVCGCMAHSATGMLTLTIDKVVSPEVADVERPANPVSEIRFDRSIPSSQLADPPFHPPRTIRL